MALKITYDRNVAPEETLDAMRDRCHEQGHDWENCMSAMFETSMKCKWCGEKK